MCAEFCGLTEQESENAKYFLRISSHNQKREQRAGSWSYRDGTCRSGIFDLHQPGRHDLASATQYAFFSGVLKDWREAWGDLSKTTQAITADTSVSQLQWSFECGVQKRPMVCERIAEHCDLAVLQCAYSNRCPLSLKACFKAAAREQL